MTGDRHGDPATDGDAAAPLARPRVRGLAASKIRDLANAGLGRPDVLPFWFGESDQPTPGSIVAAAVSALAEGRTFYTHNLGIPELREALSTYVARLHGRTMSSASIAVTSSGVSALMIAMQAVIEPGDRVVAVTPVWPNVTEIPRILGAALVRLPLRVEHDRWRLDLDALLAAITPGTRLVLLNSPNNPTGWTIEPEQRAPILERCRKVGAWLLTDDVYERLVFGESRSGPSFLAIADPRDRLISANSFSKTWLMTGWRLGWITAPPSLREDLTKLIEYNTSCAPEFIQKAGLAALAGGDLPVEALRRSLADRRDQLLTALSLLGRVTATSPDGGMYVMIRVAGFEDSMALAMRLLEEARLGLAPGVGFGAESEGWLRWCIAVRPESLAEGVRRLGAWLRSARHAS
jgi:aspartate aminotransferase